MSTRRDHLLLEHGAARFFVVKLPTAAGVTLEAAVERSKVPAVLDKIERMGLDLSVRVDIVALYETAPPAHTEDLTIEVPGDG